MERPVWISRSTIRRTDAPRWEPKRIEPINDIIHDHAIHEIKEEMMHELWGRYGNTRTFGRFVERIRTQEGLEDHR
jgi:hypothetical protein